MPLFYPPLTLRAGAGGPMSLAIALSLALLPTASAADGQNGADVSNVGDDGPPAVMRPWGQLQIFTTLLDQDESVQADPASYGDPEADPGFAIARARFGFTGVLPMRSVDHAAVDYGLSLGISTPYDALTLGDSGVSIVDAFGRIRLKPDLGDSTLALGLVKVPFSREALMSSQHLVFMERAVGAESLTSVRDVGALVRQDFELTDADEPLLVAVSLGGFNGNNDFLGDNDPGLMGAIRAELEKGDTSRTWNPAGGVAFGVGASALINNQLATRTTAWSGDGYLRVGRWSLMGELGMATLTPTDVTADAPSVFNKTNRMSWTGNTSYFQPVRDLDSELPWETAGIEFAVRASSLDDNRSLNDNGDVLIVHAGATARALLPYLDIGAGFIHREELQGRSIPNDTVRIWTQLRPRGRN